MGRPLSPVSVAGVARRQTRRAVYGAGGTVEMGRYGVGPNNGGGLVGGDDSGTHAGGPYYGGSVRGARAAYYGGSPSGAWGGVSSSDYALYIRNQHDSGLARGSYSGGGLVGGRDSGTYKP